MLIRKNEIEIHLELAERLWNYHLMHHRVPDNDFMPDAIIHLGNNDQERTVARAAEVFKSYSRPVPLVCSGNKGHLTEDMYGTEAEEAAEIAVRHGVPREMIFIEPRATNTGQNVTFSKALLEERGKDVRMLIAVQKPMMERRIAGTFAWQWPEVWVEVTSPNISFREYPTDAFPMQKVIEVLVSDLVKIDMYGGEFMTPQNIPGDVWFAAIYLAKNGFDGDLSEGMKVVLANSQLKI